MSPGDFWEWVSVLTMAPVAAAVLFIRIVTALYVFVDVQERSHSRPLSMLLAVAVGMFYWPMSFLAYLGCTVALDRRRGLKQTA